MKKRDLILDFTSLLDVIMIVLFAVLFSVGQVSRDTKAEAEENLRKRDEIEAAMLRDNEALTAEIESRSADYETKLAERDAAYEQALADRDAEWKAAADTLTADYEAKLAGKDEEIAALNETVAVLDEHIADRDALITEKDGLLSEKEAGLAEANQELDTLRTDYAALLEAAADKDTALDFLEKENLRLSAKDGESGIDSADLYEALMQSAAKITLFCETHENSEKTKSNEVEITVYAGKDEDFAQRGIVVFPHDFGLSKTKRAEANTKMKADLYAVLEEILADDPSELVLITVEYTYGDINFSQTDLDIIAAAAEDVESLMHKTCYIDKIKK